MKTMSTEEHSVLESFSKLIPTLSATEKEILLAFAEGMAFKANMQNT